MSAEPLPEQNAPLADSIVGIWGLVSREDHDAGGNRLIDPHLGADPVGMLCFSEQHFSAQFSKRDRSQPSTATAVQSANNSSAVDGYDAYFGRYWIDDTGEAIVVRLEGSITAANMGQEFKREASVSADRLLIRLETARDDGTPITRTLTFNRLR